MEVQADNENDNAMFQLLDCLTMHQYDIITQRLKEGVNSHTPTPGLPKEAFILLLANSLGVHHEDCRIADLSKKIDTNDDEFYTEEKFLNFILRHLRENEAFEKFTLIPFQDQPNFKQNVYSKQSPCKMLPSILPACLFSVSKDGVITTWSPSLVVQRGTVVDDKASEVTRSQLIRLKRSNLWVTDSTLMTSINMLVVSTTSRELNFYDVSSTVYKLQSRLCDLPRVPLCLTSYSKPTGETYLIYGDESGSVVLLSFSNPAVSLFASASKDVVSALDDIQMVLFTRLGDHAEHVSVTVLNQVHHDWILKIMYLPHNHSIISCCSSSEESLVYRHVANKRKPYIFNISKGISCFDYCHEFDLLVTGSSDHVVRFWDPYVTSRPIATFTHHRSPIVDVLIHKELGVIFSLSHDTTLCAWSAKEHNLLQSITVKFPFSQRQQEYGHKPLFLLSPSILTVSCNEHIGEYTLGAAGNIGNNQGGWGIMSHCKPLTAAVYDSLYDQVISACESGELLVWNVLTGSKNVRIKETHNGKEITCLIMDSECKRVFSGSSNGEVKVWNHINGECVKYMKTPGNMEVTGLVHHKNKILVTGWNRRISGYPDVADVNVMSLKREDAWLKNDSHKDDITTMCFCPPYYLATGSFDGVIVIWNTETEKPIVTLKTKRYNQPNTKSSSSSRRRSSLISMASLGSASIHSLSSHQSSRRLSAYCLKANSANLQYTPVDKLLFLKTRMTSRSKYRATLVSCEAGYASFWSIPGENEPIGSFSLTNDDGDNRNVLGLCTDSKDQFLIAGDILGYITIFDIDNYCNGSVAKNTAPPCLATWQSHSAEILSVECIRHKEGVFVLSASADCTVRLWNMKGHYIGTFGQKHNWNLSDATTFQHPNTPWSSELNSSSMSLLQNDEETNDGTKTSKLKSTADNTLQVPSINDQAVIIPTDQKFVEKNKDVAISIASGPSSLVSSQSSLPPVIDDKLYKQYGERASKRMEGKYNRRQHYSDIDMKSTERFGLQCSPYQALQLLNIKDATIPNSIADVLKSS